MSGHDDAARGVLHSRAFQPKTLHSGRAAGRNQQHVAMHHAYGRVQREDSVRMGDCLGAPVHAVDAFRGKDLFEQRTRFRLFLRQQCLRDERHRCAEPAITLRDLAANGAATHHEQPLRQAFVLENLLIRHEGHTLDPRNIGYTRLGSRVD